MNKINRTYESLLLHILNNGYDYEDPNRVGVKRREVLNYTFRHEFEDGFPAITTKKLAFKSVITELLWFLRGDTNIKYLLDNCCNIWNKDAYNYYLKQCEKSNIKKLGKQPLPIEQFIEFVKNDSTQIGITSDNYKLGDLGPVYGKQWRSFNGVDQIQKLIKNLKEKPLATDHIVNSWNVGDLEEMALPPCHYGFQVVVRPLSESERILIFKEKFKVFNGLPPFSKLLDDKNIPKYGFELHWNQRSVDTFLGLPFNIASYTTLALIIEKIIGYKALAIQGELKKVHLYDNSFDAVKEQLGRDVDKYDCGVFDFPAFDEYKWETLDELFNKIQPEDITLEGYESYPRIKIEMLERNIPC